MITSADAEMMSDAFDVSGSSCFARIAAELAAVLIPSASRRMPMPNVPTFFEPRRYEKRAGCIGVRTGTHLRSRSLRLDALSSPGWATLRKRHTTSSEAITSIADWIPKKISDRDRDSAPNPIERPPSTPLYTTLMMLIATAYCWRRR